MRRLNRSRKGRVFIRLGLHGRLMRDGEGEGGQTPADNSGVKTDPPAGESNGADNSGGALDLTQFWNNPDAGGQSDPSQSSGGDPEEDIGKVLVGEIAQYNPGNLFNDDLAKQIGEGNLDGINAAFANLSQNILRQSVINSAKIMQRFEAAIEQRISSHIQSSQQQTGDEQMLKDNFPSFANPSTQPMIRGVFNQALKHSKGDRSKAITMAKDFLRSMGPQGGEDFGFTPPRNPDDNYMAGNSKSLVEDLLGMKGN